MEENTYFSFVSITYLQTFIHAVYCNTVIIPFNAQIVSTLARGSPFQLASVPFDVYPSFFEHFCTGAQNVLGLSLFSFLIEHNLYIVQQTDLKYILKRFWISVYNYITHTPYKDTEKFEHPRIFYLTLL